MPLVGQTLLQFDLREVHRGSMELLELLEQMGVTEEEAVVMLALSLGRLLCPTRPMHQDDEVDYLNAVIEWHQALWPEGGLN